MSQGWCAFLVSAGAGVSNLPGQKLWQPYLDAAPQSAEDFSRNPLDVLLSFLPEDPVQILTQLAHGYAEILLFLLAVIVLAFLLEDGRDSELLELVSAVGCGVLLWGRLAELAQTICEKMTEWKSFLLGFLPIYGGVLTAGGEANAGASSCGLLLSGLCLLAQCAALWTSPLMQSYLAISMACCISSQKELSDGCRMVGALLRKGLSWAGKIFALLLGLQRVVTLQMDKTVLRMSRLVTGSVPVIGEALSGTAETIFAGMQLLKSSLGLACMAILGAEFVPLYLTLMLHLLLLTGCGFLCELAGNDRCRNLFSCLTEAVRCMAAVTALFFGLMIVGTTALMAVGGG